MADIQGLQALVLTSSASHVQDMPEGFDSLQRHIAALAQELQDEILLQLIKYSLQPGKIVLRPHRFLKTNRPFRWRLAQAGKGNEAPWSNIVHAAYHNSFPKPYFGVLLALNMKWLKVAREILHRGNTWIVPLSSVPGPGSYVFRGRDQTMNPLLCLEISMGHDKTGYQLKGPPHHRTLRLWSPKRYSMPNLRICDVLHDCGLGSTRGARRFLDYGDVIIGLRDAPATDPKELVYEESIQAWIDAYPNRRAKFLEAMRRQFPGGNISSEG